MSNSACWRTPDGASRSKTFVRKVEAEQFLTSVNPASLRADYVDATAGRITFAEYAGQWLERKRTTTKPTTGDPFASHLRRHLVLRFGSRSLLAISRVDAKGVRGRPRGPGCPDDRKLCNSSAELSAVVRRGPRAECIKATRDGLVPDPQAALLACHEAGVDEDLHVMADRRLRAARRLDEIARGHLALGRGDERQQPEPDRVGQGGERLGEQLGLVLVEDCPCARACSRRRDRAWRSGRVSMTRLYRRSSKKSVDGCRIVRQTRYIEDGQCGVVQLFGGFPCPVSNSPSTSVTSMPLSTSTPSCSIPGLAKIRENYANFA